MLVLMLVLVLVLMLMLVNECVLSVTSAIVFGWQL